SGTRKRRVRRGDKVHVKFPKLQRVRTEIHEKGRLACGGLNRSVHIGRQKAVDAAGLLEADHCRSVACEHRRAVSGAGICAKEYSASRVEHVERKIVSIAPDTHLGIVIEIWQSEGIPVVSSRGVVGRRYGYTLEERGRAHGELCRDPTVGHFVVLDNWVAVVVVLASAAKTRPEGISRGRTHQLGPSVFVENGKRAVHPLNILSCAHHSICIRRSGVHHEPRLSLPQTFKIQAQGCGYRWQVDSLQRSIDSCRGGRGGRG